MKKNHAKHHIHVAVNGRVYTCVCTDIISYSEFCDMFNYLKGVKDETLRA